MPASGTTASRRKTMTSWVRSFIGRGTQGRHGGSGAGGFLLRFLASPVDPLCLRYLREAGWRSLRGRRRARELRVDALRDVTGQFVGGDRTTPWLAGFADFEGLGRWAGD